MRPIATGVAWTWFAHLLYIIIAQIGIPPQELVKHCYKRSWKKLNTISDQETSNSEALQQMQAWVISWLLELA